MLPLLLALHLALPAPAHAATSAEEVCYETTNADGEVIVTIESLEESCAVSLVDGRTVQVFADEDLDTCLITSDADDGGGTIIVICPPTRLSPGGSLDVLIWPT